MSRSAPGVQRGFTGLTDADRTLLLLADNRLAEKAGWDRRLLALELQALIDLDFEVETTGFEMAEIDIVLDEAGEAQDPAGSPDADTPALPASPVSQSGDLWLLGDHRLPKVGHARDQHAGTTAVI